MKILLSFLPAATFCHISPTLLIVYGFNYQILVIPMVDRTIIFTNLIQMKDEDMYFF